MQCYTSWVRGASRKITCIKAWLNNARSSFSMHGQEQLANKTPSDFTIAGGFLLPEYRPALPGIGADRSAFHDENTWRLMPFGQVEV